MATVPIINPGFEDGDFTGWTIEPSGTGWAEVSTDGAPYGTYCAKFNDYGTDIIFNIFQTAGVPVWEGAKITASCTFRQGAASSGHNTGQIVLMWYDVSDVKIGEATGNLIKSSGGTDITSVTATAPANTAFVRVGGRCNKNRPNAVRFDQFTWDFEVVAAVDLTFPTQGSFYNLDDSVPFRVSVTTGVPVESIEYKVTDTTTAAVTSVGTSSTSPFDVNYSSLPTGSYSAQATATLSGGYELLSDAQTFTIGSPPAPTLREFKASNAYTYLVTSNFYGIGNAIPSTARVVGVKTILDYNVKALIRSKDKDIDDPTVARYQAAFDMVPSLTFETVLLDVGTSDYTSLGNTITGSVDITRSDFVVQEDGTSESKRWTVLQGEAKNLDIGGDGSFFGLGQLAASDFFTKAVGVRAYPNLDSVPSYADSGDACFRINIDKMRLQVSFDPGSVEYYFASPDKTKVLKGTLVHFCVDNGDFRTADAEGVLQIEYDLEIKDGTQKYIGPDWTIHSEYPPTDGNKIGDVAPSEQLDAVGMEYNGLPTQAEVIANKSRYEFISHNFYGDKDWDAIYGVNGVGKAFSFNGEWFYKICTGGDPDTPRHVAHHHQHLALGFEPGRVDISVVGERTTMMVFLALALGLSATRL